MPFKNWLAGVTQQPASCWFDMVIDGANVGYYKQNFIGAASHIEYRQVDWMLASLMVRMSISCLSVAC